MNIDDRITHKRLNDWEWADRIELVIVPRYKTSGLSGDEWRTGVAVRFFFKGEKVHEDFFTSMDAALLRLQTVHSDAACPIPNRVLEIERSKCDQPSCCNDAVGRFLLKRETSRNGDYLDPKEQYFAKYRQFCKQHLRRGDCSREDADSNYTPMDGWSPEQSSNVIESPSVFGGVVELGIDTPARGEPS